jgi:hypothetical protein
MVGGGIIVLGAFIICAIKNPNFQIGTLLFAARSAAIYFRVPQPRLASTISHRPQLF